MLSFKIDCQEEENIGRLWCSLLPELLHKVWAALGDYRFSLDPFAMDYIQANDVSLLQQLRERGIIVGTTLDYRRETEITGALVPAFQELVACRSSMRSLLALASTCKWFYMDFKKRYKAIYYDLAPLAMFYSPDASLLERQPEMNILGNPANFIPNTTEWYIAAARLCLWPGGHKTYVGFSVARYGNWRCVRSEALEYIIPQLTPEILGHAVHSTRRAFACEGAQVNHSYPHDGDAAFLPDQLQHVLDWTETYWARYETEKDLSDMPPSPRGLIELRDSHRDPMNQNYGHTCFIWSWWHGSLHRKYSRSRFPLLKGIAMVQELLHKDIHQNVRHTEESYWRIIYDACQPGPCPFHSKPKSPRKKMMLLPMGGDSKAAFQCPTCCLSWPIASQLRRHINHCIHTKKT